MSRALGRWIVLGVLGAVVIGLGIATSLASRRLVEGLAAGDPHAFSQFSERQDAYIFLQSETVATRLKVARSLAGWGDPAAAKLALTLVPDPDPTVRAALVNSLYSAAKLNPRAVAAEFQAGGAAESAALIEAASRDTTVGAMILGQVLAEQPASPNGLLLAKRLGSASEPLLFPMLKNEDPNVQLSAAEALVSLGLDDQDERRVSATLIDMYRTAETVAFKDRLLPVLAAFAPKGAAGIFREVALDHEAPSDLRAVATRALAAIGDPIVAQLATDADTAVSAAALK